MPLRLCVTPLGLFVLQRRLRVTLLGAAHPNSVTGAAAIPPSAKDDGGFDAVALAAHGVATTWPAPAEQVAKPAKPALAVANVRGPEYPIRFPPESHSSPVKEQIVGLMDWIKKTFTSTPSQAAVAAHTLGRNDQCWCGSGKKYKKCHLSSDAHHRVEQSLSARSAAEFAARNGASIVPQGSSKKRKGNLPPEAVQPPTG
jgi:hypothetical protein